MSDPHAPFERPSLFTEVSRLVRQFPFARKSSRFHTAIKSVQHQLDYRDSKNTEQATPPLTADLTEIDRAFTEATVAQRLRIETAATQMGGIATGYLEGKAEQDATIAESRLRQAFDGSNTHDSL